ncbi:arsenate reductase (glutaredoxin) [Paracoccus marinaquae]|uniref:Arsenate reductase n=1 Tax=Paracoccus marinaquae TaxID=2841926 RepID=A0ABS6ADD3_9RHOB|nr:arsenate reductase (glutaredoxin) [Paracoccus marinaquae]MBU3028607.1 arsenate reductase (glutaredoxin) [Paracoccus marinaquae]
MAGEWIIWHNPKCSTSRFVLQALRDGGLEPVVRDYQKDPPSEAELRAVLAAAGIPARGLLRRKSPAFDELDLGGAARSEDELVAAMAAHPEVIERPVVIMPDGRARLCRPKETVFALLEAAG